jgi:hypothetical protein
MNKLLKQLKEDLALAMKVEIGIRKGLDEDGKALLELSGGEDVVIAQKTVSRAIISMIPQLGKKPEETTEEDIQQLLKKYIGMEKERTLYELSFLKEKDIAGKSASEVKKIVTDKIQELGDEVTSHQIEIAQEYLPKQASEEEIKAFIETIDMSKFKNKMQAMGLIMKQFPGLDGNFAKKILMDS